MCNLRGMEFQLPGFWICSNHFQFCRKVSRKVNYDYRFETRQLQSDFSLQLETFFEYSLLSNSNYTPSCQVTLHANVSLTCMKCNFARWRVISHHHFPKSSIFFSNLRNVCSHGIFFKWCEVSITCNCTIHKAIWMPFCSQRKIFIGSVCCIDFLWYCPNLVNPFTARSG